MNNNDELLDEEKRTVLIADDDAIQIIGLSSFLQKYWFKVIKAYDWKQAFELVQQYKSEIYCIVIDNNMPNLTWLEAAKKIREILQDVMIILLSWDNLEKEEWENAWINYHLKKPCDVNKLKELISIPKKQ